MIKFNNDFEFERDKYQWILHHWVDGKDKDGNPKRSRRTTYHGTLSQLCDVIMERTCGRCESLAEIVTLLNHASKALTLYAEMEAA